MFWQWKVVESYKVNGKKAFFFCFTFLGCTSGHAKNIRRGEDYKFCLSFLLRGDGGSRCTECPSKTVTASVLEFHNVSYSGNLRFSPTDVDASSCNILSYRDCGICVIFLLPPEGQVVLIYTSSCLGYLLMSAPSAIPTLLYLSSYYISPFEISISIFWPDTDGYKVQVYIPENLVKWYFFKSNNILCK